MFFFFPFLLKILSVVLFGVFFKFFYNKRATTIRAKATKAETVEAGLVLVPVCPDPAGVSDVQSPVAISLSLTVEVVRSTSTPSPLEAVMVILTLIQQTFPSSFPRTSTVIKFAFAPVKAATKILMV